jgi:hypothetical protein
MGIWGFLKARFSRGESARPEKSIHTPEEIAKGADIDPLLKYSDVTLSPEARALLRRSKESE